MGMGFDSHWFDRVRRFVIFDIDILIMMSYNNSIFDISAKMFSILVLR